MASAKLDKSNPKKRTGASARVRQSRPAGKARALTWQSVPRLSRLAFFQVVCLLIFSKLLPQVENLFMLAACVHALRGGREAIEALAATFLLLMGSRAWGMESLITDLRWLVVLAATISAIRTLADRRSLDQGLWLVILAIFGFGVVNILTGLQVSRYPTVSVFKLISFMVGSMAIILNYAQSRRSAKGWGDYFSGWFAGLLFCGTLSLLWGGGFTRNGSGFEGGLGHPQTNGVVMGVGMAFFLSQYLLRRSGGGWYGIFALFCLFSVYSSQCRTGMFAMILAGGIAVVFLWLTHGQALATTRIFKHAVATGGMGCVGLLFLPSLYDSLIGEFVAKDTGSSQNLGEAFTDSRQDLIDASMMNFRTSPEFGIGFGVPTSDFTKIKTVGGIPLGASVEKGFLPSAVLEETGVTGAALLLILLTILLGRQLNTSNAKYLWPMLAAIFCNLGEAIFFAIGGAGMFVWIMIGLAVTENEIPTKERLKKKRASSQIKDRTKPKLAKV